MAVYDPHAVTIDDTPFAETTLESANEAQPEAHQYSAGQEKRSAAPLVDVENGRNWGEGLSVERDGRQWSLPVNATFKTY